MKLIVFSRPDLYYGEAAQLNSLLTGGLWRLHLRKPQASREQVERLYEQIQPEWRSHVVLHHYQQGVSHSCHSFEEVTQWKSLCQYVFLSPIFNSISKKGYLARFPLTDLQQAQKSGIIDQRVVALGGITPTQVPFCRALGFGGVAILGWIWEGTGFLDRFRCIQQAVDASDE